MSLLKRLWNWIIRKTSTAPKLTVVEAQEEPQETPTEILVRILLEDGINMREISIMKIEEKFDNWYDGPPSEESVKAAFPEFKKAHRMKFSREP